MVTVKQLTYQIDGKSILKNINLEFNARHIYAVIGPNGAGKSTLLKHIMGILTTTQGEIFIQGIESKTLKSKAYAKQCSFVFQENNRDFELTVEEIIAMGRYPYVDFLGNLTADDHTIIDGVIKDLGLETLRKQFVKTLSGGEAQKVFIARALAQQTPILLLDEPTSMLDIHNSIEILNQLKEIQEKYDLTIIMVMHDLNLAFQYASDIVLLREGQVVLQDNKDKILESSELQEVYGNKIKLIKDNGSVYIVPKVG